MKLKNIARNSLFVKSFNLAKSSPGKTGLMVLFDAMFIISFFTLQKLFGYFASNLAVSSLTSTFYLLIIFSLIYYLVILFLYSFFKYSVLDFIKSLFNETKFSFNRLWQFYILNIAIAGIFLAIMLALNFILINIREPYAPYAFIVLAAPYSLFLYIVVNISHSKFYEGNTIKTAIKKSIIASIAKIKNYRETIFVMVIGALILWLSFLGIGYLLRLSTSMNFSLYLIFYSYFKQASIIVLDIVIYLFILINRISFYAAIKENKG